MMNTVAPVWDGNETWLVLGGAALFAAFPIVYATVLSALYLPLVLMLLVCLIFRGVSFEIRAKAQRTKHMWDLAFIGSSAGATFFQGVALGAFLDGIPVADGHFAGDAFGWFTPFAIFTSTALVVTYALLGACWLIAKTEGDLQRRMYCVVWPLTLLCNWRRSASSASGRRCRLRASRRAGSIRRGSTGCCPCRCWSRPARGRCAARSPRVTRRGLLRWRSASCFSAIRASC